MKEEGTNIFVDKIKVTEWQDETEDRCFEYEHKDFGISVSMGDTVFLTVYGPSGSPGITVHFRHSHRGMTVSIDDSGGMDETKPRSYEEWDKVDRIIDAITLLKTL